MGSFFLGVNLGTLYLERDSARQPPPFQHYGASAGVLLLLCAPLLLPAEAFPTFIQHWRSQGLFAPLYCLIIWYIAHGQDMLCSLLNSHFLVFMGEISYAIYVFQQVS